MSFITLRRRDDEAGFRRAWEAFLVAHPASLHYTLHFLDYLLQYARNLMMDESFVLIEEGRPVGVCFLPLERGPEGITVSLAGDFVYAPLARDERTEKELHQLVDGVCRAQAIGKVLFCQDTLLDLGRGGYNRLLRHGYVHSCTTDIIIALQQEEAMLWSGVRKGHKYDINRFYKNPDLAWHIVDHRNPDYQVNEAYRRLHAKCAGRETRVKATFDKQFDMLKDDQAAILGATYRGEWVAFNYFMHAQGTVEYASAADDPDYLEATPLYHALLWEAVRYYRERGFRAMRLTEPCGHHAVDGFLDLHSPKQARIGRYKRGFGGEQVFLNRGTRYYDHALFARDLDRFKEEAMAAMVAGGDGAD